MDSCADENTVQRACLIEMFRNAQSDEKRREICTELEKLFDSRAAWQRRHSRSYNWAKANGVIVSKVAKGWRNGRPCDAKRYNAITKAASARAELHRWCKHRNVPVWQEIALGESLKSKVAKGNRADVSLMAVIEGYRSGDHMMALA